jgi:hypothetical protein
LFGLIKQEVVCILSFWEEQFVVHPDSWLHAQVKVKTNNHFESQFNVNII